MLWLIYHNKPVPVSKVILLQKLSKTENAVFTDFQRIVTTGKSLRNAFLGSRLSDIKLGTWSLASDTLNLLEQQIHILKPRFILEFGSGFSTPCLARYMQELHGDSSWYVLSIEQDFSFMQKTLELVEELQLGKCVQVVHCPLRRQVIGGVRTTCYDLSHSVRATLAEKRPDVAVIDGPSGKPGVRFGTLPLVLHFLSPGAWFFLDDALRDAELEIAQRWSRFSNVRIDGIYLIGKGLLVGQVLV